MDVRPKQVVPLRSTHRHTILRSNSKICTHSITRRVCFRQELRALALVSTGKDHTGSLWGGVPARGFEERLRQHCTVLYPSPSPHHFQHLTAHETIYFRSIITNHLRKQRGVFDKAKWWEDSRAPRLPHLMISSVTPTLGDLTSSFISNLHLNTPLCYTPSVFAKEMSGCGYIMHKNIHNNIHNNIHKSIHIYTCIFNYLSACKSE